MFLANTLFMQVSSGLCTGQDRAPTAIAQALVSA